MSLSAAEKVRVVQALDRLGVHYVEAGFPSSNPKEAELFELLADVELEHGAGLRLRHDPPARPRRRGRSGAARAGRLLRARSCTLVGKTWALHLDKVTKVSREENLAMITDSVCFCSRRGQARRLRRRALLRRLARGPRLRARVPAGRGRGRGRERHPLRHERLQPAGPGRRGDRGGGRGARRPREVGIHTHNDAECGVANSLAAVDAGARLVQGTINGYGERARQRQPGLDPPGAAAEDGLRVRSRRIACGG